MGAIAARRSSARTGALERSDPLPPGRYWIDIFHEPAGNKSIWDTWVQNGVMAGAVLIETTESRADHDPPSDFYIFTVSKPWGWGIAEYVGWPSIAPPDIQTSNDTVQKPPPEPTGFGIFGEGGALEMPGWVPWAVGGVVVVVGLFAISRITSDARSIVA